MGSDWERVWDLLDRARNIIAFTGAGVSTGAGIPDFRSPGGLYAQAEERYGVPYPEALFDIAYFQKDPRPFFRFSRDLLRSEAEPGPCHRLLARLEEEGRLSLTITQNIDRLHRRAGSRKLLACHGSYDRARCRGCGAFFEPEQFEPVLLAGEPPRCSCGGVIKPEVTFFGESLPPEFSRLAAHPPEGDLLLILGTSLTVQPACLLAADLARRMPAVLVNRDPTPYDGLMRAVLTADVDAFARRAEERLG